MLRLSLHLPLDRRLDFRLVKRRGNHKAQPLLPSIGKILNVKKGNKISRFFRHIFEHKRIKKVFGSNLAALIIASSVLSANTGTTVNADSIYLENKSIDLSVKTESGTRYPLESVSVTQGYHLFHPGIDFDSITGEPVYPVMSGRVAEVQYSNIGYGNAIYIRHNQEYSTLYAHLFKIEVNKGDFVSQDKKIGEVGATGRAFGDHLHFELRENDYPINPHYILPSR